MTRQIFRLRSVDMVVITIAATLAALAVFARSPETVMLTSVDGVMTLAGEVPRSFGDFRIVRDDVVRDELAPDARASVYRLEPVGMLLPQPVMLSFSLAGVEGIAREALALGWWNETAERWELVPSSYDARTNAIRAPISTLGLWTIRQR